MTQMQFEFHISNAWDLFPKHLSHHLESPNDPVHFSSLIDHARQQMMILIADWTSPVSEIGQYQFNYRTFVKLT